MDSHIFLKIKTKWEISKKNLLAFSKYSNFMILTVIKCHILFLWVQVLQWIYPSIFVLTLVWFFSLHTSSQYSFLWPVTNALTTKKLPGQGQYKVIRLSLRKSPLPFLACPCLWWKEAFTKHLRRFFSHLFSQDRYKYLFTNPLMIEIIRLSPCKSPLPFLACPLSLMKRGFYQKY